MTFCIYKPELVEAIKRRIPRIPKETTKICIYSHNNSVDCFTREENAKYDRFLNTIYFDNDVRRAIELAINE